MAPSFSQIADKCRPALHHLRRHPRSPTPTSPNFTRPSSLNTSCVVFVRRSPRVFTPNACRRIGFLDPGASGVKSERMGFDYFRLPAVSDGGSGGNGGIGGTGSGGGGSGGGGEDSVGNSWSILSWYLTALEKHPTLTKAWTSAFLTLIGDVICQLLIDHVVALDLKRTFVFTLLGFALVGPTLHFWYFYLSKLVTIPGAFGAFLRLLIDQFLFSPTFIGVFLASLVTLEGRPSQVIPKLQQEWFPSVLANWQLWIPFQFLNFQFVPQKFQVLAANVIALVWNVILSFKAHKEIQPKSTA